MADSRRDPQPGDLLTKGEDMVAVTSREGNLVRWMMRVKSGSEIDGMSTIDEWFQMTCEATPAGTVKIHKRNFDAVAPPLFFAGHK
jgi:hypothetical protein